MILHCVYLGVAPDAPTAERVAVMDSLAGLIGQIDGFTGFDHGRNIDVEGKSPESAYGFVCTFTDRDALDRYAADTRHQALGARLVALCGGADRIKVYDIDCAGS